MKVAAAYENGKIFQHFGHSEHFKLYDITDGRIISSTIINTNGSGHGALADLLKNENVDTLICGGIGAGAQNMLKKAGIELFGGFSGNADDAVTALLEGSLSYQPDVSCTHHNGHTHGDCHGGHDQSEHHCGGHCHE